MVGRGKRLPHPASRRRPHDGTRATTRRRAHPRSRRRGRGESRADSLRVPARPRPSRRVRRRRKAALQALRDEAFDVALLDIVMPEMDGLETLKQLRAEPDPPQVIIITGNGTVETAITAMKLGAYDYMAKPYRMAEIDVLVRRAWEKHQLARENRYLQARLSRVDATPEVITQYAPMHAVLALRRARGDDRFAGADHRRIGNGKDAARARDPPAVGARRPDGRSGQHRRSPRAARRRAVRPRARRVHRRGRAQGGAHRAGARTARCSSTTSACSSAKLQSKLARALEHGSFFRVGGTQKVDIAVRLVTSSKHDLEAAVARGTVPRRSVLSLEHRDRVAAAAARARGGHSAARAAFPDAARRRVGADADARRDRAMQEYSWPGNIRELRNVIERVGAAWRGDGDARDSRAGPAAPPAARRRAPPSARRHARGARAAAHRRGAGADQLAPGQRGEDARHLVEDAVPKDPRVRIRASARRRGRARGDQGRDDARRS